MITITGQVPEEFLYKDEVYSLAGVKGVGLFSADEFGIPTQSASTACYRGFQMGFKIQDNELRLNWMVLKTDLSPPPSINGIEPQQITERYSMFSHRYEDLNIKSHFTGKLLIGKDFIQSMYVHMGFQKPIAYEIVLELFLEEGTITEIKDRSKEVEVLRKQAIDFDPDKDSIETFIKYSFSLYYDF